MIKVMLKELIKITFFHVPSLSIDIKMQFEELSTAVTNETPEEYPTII